MNQTDPYEEIGQHSIDVKKGEDGLFTASAPGTTLPPVRARSSQEATQKMATALDTALKTNKLPRL